MHAGLAESVVVALLLPYRALADAALSALMVAQLPTDFLMTEDLLAVILSSRLLPMLLSSTAAWHACGCALAAYQGIAINPEALVELRHCIAPHVLAQLVSDGQYAHAASFACHFLRLHPLLATLDGGMSLLEPCLRGHARAARASDTALLSVTGCQLPCTAERLFKSVSAVCDTAVAALSAARAPK